MNLFEDLGLQDAPFEIERSAVISACGLFRLRLDRRIAMEGKTMGLIGVNPSTANGDIDDATIRKGYGFSKRHGVAKLIVGNKCSFRATDVNELKTAIDPIGPECDIYLEQIMREADFVVAAWGPLAKLPQRLRNRWKDIVAIADRVGKPLHCFGTAQDGHPRHPLMLAYDTPLTLWSTP